MGQGQEKVVKTLLRAGASVHDTNERGMNALHVAASDMEYGTMQLILRTGVDVEARDKEGRTAMVVAACRGAGELMNLLEDEGADPIAIDPESKMSIMHWIAFKGEHTLFSKVMRMDPAAAQRQFNARDKKGRTPLYLAVMAGRLRTVEKLISQGSSVSKADITLGLTPLHVAAGRGLIEIVHLLIEHGASVTAKDKNGLQPAAWAEANKFMNVAAILYEKSAPVVRAPVPQTILELFALPTEYESDDDSHAGTMSVVSGDSASGSGAGSGDSRVAQRGGRGGAGADDTDSEDDLEDDLPEELEAGLRKASLTSL